MKKSSRPDLSGWVDESCKFTSASSSKEHLANPFANILNETSKMVELYHSLIRNQPILLNFIQSLFFALGPFLKSCIYWPKTIPVNLYSGSVDIIIISHLTSLEQLKNNDDFYFGSLEKYLEGEGFTVRRVLINHAKAGYKDLLANSKTIVLPAYLSPLKELILLGRLFKASLKIKSNYLTKKRQKFLWRVRLAQFGKKAITDYRIGTNLASIIGIFKPVAVLHTYEGHGWEKIIDAEAHDMSFSPIMFGYQHAVLFPGAKSIFRKHGKAIPDHIFTVGSITKKMFIENSEMPPEFFSILGSIKSASTDQYPQFSAIGACLVAPEGSLKELKLMVQLTLNAAKKNKNQKFILRLHPVLIRADVENILLDFGPIPENFFISNASLIEDLKRSSWLCYRGSTVAFQGMLVGLRPIYLDSDDSAEFNDPIPNYIRFKRTAISATELNDVIWGDKKSSQECNQNLEEAFNFSREYFMKFQPSVISSAIKKLSK